MIETYIFVWKFKLEHVSSQFLTQQQHSHALAVTIRDSYVKRCSVLQSEHTTASATCSSPHHTWRRFDTASACCCAGFLSCSLGHEVIKGGLKKEKKRKGKKMKKRQDKTRQDKTRKGRQEREGKETLRWFPALTQGRSTWNSTNSLGSKQLML